MRNDDSRGFNLVCIVCLFICLFVSLVVICESVWGMGGVGGDNPFCALMPCPRYTATAALPSPPCNNRSVSQPAAPDLKTGRQVFQIQRLQHRGRRRDGERGEGGRSEENGVVKYHKVSAETRLKHQELDRAVNIFIVANCNF